ncbi:family 78 glycoside hydrolase catalytic domain [uncultured Pseudokineococcus sp.]|uniref:family 78 glycoside hydrolase catalytic domain n=1 Tax=uncultured Pseudokineococcus sp. TaxID=1642928 RepID=UPI0026251A40|nr:family 78 glycoside hydrolase catalytic domain [uncultured Pseudokineococcus sp.]
MSRRTCPPPHRRSGSRAAAACLAVGVVVSLVTPASADAPGRAGLNRAPEPPRHLTVGDREEAANVEGVPQLGWWPEDPDHDEVQTAYQVEVVDASGGVLWDSGRVPGAQQSYVDYGGPALAPGADHSWRVRTWDRGGLASPWSPWSHFSTGLSDGDWEGASWIQRPQTRPGDEWTLARREVDVDGDDVVRATAYVAGSHTYELRVDGVRADRGQSFAYPGEGYYKATDITGLVAGKQRVALGAVLHWYGSGQGRPAGVPGLLVKVVVEHADGSRQVVVSDGSWTTSPGPYVASPRRNGEGDRVEHLDARLVQPGWDAVGFDDSEWSGAAELGEHPVAPFTALQAQHTRMEETTARPVALLRADDGTVVADFGRVVPARPRVRFDEGVTGRVVEMRAGYELREDGRVDDSTLASQGTDMSFPYTQVDGPQEFAAFTHLAFRYLEIPGADEDVALEDVSAVVVHRQVPAGRAAELSSSDPVLDDVWDLMQRSALYSVQEAFVDTPTREKGQFLGDAADISYATMAGFGERDVTRQALLEFLTSSDRFWSEEGDRGRYNAVYPNGDGKRDIPDYSLMMVDWVWRYYEETGDRDLLETAYPYMLQTADYVRRAIPAEGPTAGLVTELPGGSGPYLHGIVDWPEPGRFGYDMSTVARTTINAQSVAVLEDVARMAEELGEDDAGLREDSRALADRMNATLRTADGLYVDGLRESGEQSDHAGQHATSYAIAYGVAPEEDWPLLAEHLDGLGMAQGPMTVHRLLEALGESGRPDAVLERLTDPDDLGWADILRRGGTFTWEAWTLDPGTNFSQSHGWSSQALVDVQEYLLGVETTSPGAQTITVAPPEDVLERVAGTVPTQRGPVSVEWRRTGPADTVVLVLDVPVGTTARVELPVADGVTYEARGRGDARSLGSAGGRAVFEVGSGLTRFVPRAGR